MTNKEEIVKNWLPRYTGRKLEDFGEYILLTNFSNYVELFAQWNNVEVIGKEKLGRGCFVNKWECAINKNRVFLLAFSQI